MKNPGKYWKGRET